MRKNSRQRPPKPKVNVKENVSKIFISAKSYLPLMIFASLFLVGGVVFQVISPTILRKVTNEIAKASFNAALMDYEYIVKEAVKLTWFYCAFFMLQTIANIILNEVIQRYGKELRTQLIKKINRLPLNYFDTKISGDIASRLSNDVDAIGQSLQTSFGTLIQSVCLLVAVIIAMFISNYQLALIVIASVPLMFIILSVMNMIAIPQFIKRQEFQGILQGKADESYSGQIVVSAFNCQAKFEKQFDKTNKDLANATFRAQIFGGLMMPSMNFVAYIVTASVCIGAGLLLSNGELNGGIGTIAEFMVYINLFQSPLNQIAQSINALQTGAASAKRVFEFLEEEEISDESNKSKNLLNSDTPLAPNGTVQFENVKFGYDPEKIIIKDFSAKVKPGYKVAIVGPTGAGKTTLVNLIMRFYELNSGDIKLNGLSSSELSRQEIHDNFAMVLQDTWLFEGTIRENLMFNNPDVTEEQIMDVLKKCGLKHHIASLPGGLDYHIKDGSELSAGEKQLVTIARAMLKKSNFLILDEATSNVDTRSEEKIQIAMDDLMKGKTSFVIAHRLSTIRNSDLILVMNEGNIVEQGSHDELMKLGGFYSELYNSQFSL